MLEEKTKKERLIPLSFDLMFKKVFGDENDKRPLEYLLKVVLEMEVKDLRILSNEILGESIDSKKTTVDLIVTLEDGKKVGIEMNKTVSKEIIDRNLMYMFRIMSNSLRHNENYERLDKHIQINFDMEGYHEKPIETYKIISTSNIHNVLTDKLEIIRIDVPYFTNKCYNEEELTEQERLLGLIGMTDRKKIDEVIGESEIMEEIKKKIEDFSEDEKMAAVYDYDFHLREVARIAAKKEFEEKNRVLDEKRRSLEEKTKGLEEKTRGLEEDRKKFEKTKKEVEKTKKEFEEYLEKGLEQIKEKEEAISVKEESILRKKEAILEKGKRDGIIQMAKKMLDENIEIEIISKITNLSTEKINTLK